MRSGQRGGECGTEGGSVALKGGELEAAASAAVEGGELDAAASAALEGR